MSTLEMRAMREMSPNVRDISRFRKYPVMRVIEVPNRKKRSAVSKLKLVAVSVFAAFLFVTTVNEGVRIWLKHTGGNAEASSDFMVQRSQAVMPQVIQPVMVSSRQTDQVGLLREQNRYRVDMTREQNRFVRNVLGTAERTVSRLSR